MIGSIRSTTLPLLFVLLSVGSAAAQDANGDGRITYLIPINVPRPTAGALGTTWQTELWIHNATEMPLNLVGCPLIPANPSQPCEGIPFHGVAVTEKAFPYETDWPGTSALVFDLHSWETPIVLSSRLYELSRHAQPAGVEMPIVREDHFFKEASRFIGINGSSFFRVALRIYDARRRQDSRVRVEFFRQDGSLIVSSVMPLSFSSFELAPSYAASYDLAGAFPQLVGIDRYDIRVTPLTPGMDYWALVSVTDQDTQQVLLVTAD